MEAKAAMADTAEAKATEATAESKVDQKGQGEGVSSAAGRTMPISARAQEMEVQDK